jgi:hypothetical protein
MLGASPWIGVIDCTMVETGRCELDVLAGGGSTPLEESELDSIGGVRELLELDSIGGALELLDLELLELDSIGGARELLELDSIGGARELLELDSLGGVQAGSCMLDASARCAGVIGCDVGLDCLERK